MARPSPAGLDPVKTALAAWSALSALPPAVRIGLVALAAMGCVLYYVVTHAPQRAIAPNADPATGLNPDGSGTFLFCFWNVENLFDDRDDKRREVDEPYDNAFANNAALRQSKYDRLADALLKMNGGKGPDILACAEVESVRAAELLRDTLNRKLGEAKLDPKWSYTQVEMKNLDGGRHIAPCVITRLNVAKAATRLHGSQLRILETRLVVNGYELCVVASHWTSQLKQRDGSGGESGREKYARTVHKVYADLAARNAAADFLLCGDFNETPENVSEALHTTADPAELRAPGDAKLLDLLLGKPPEKFGTLYYGGKPKIYDHICVSPGMLDGRGWGCDPDSIRTYTEGLTRPGATRREPWRFGDPARAPVGGRGFSDHFPVTLTLKLQPPAGRASVPNPPNPE